ncbi:copper resistance system multicopper oxidase [Gluconacetobacter entanii]|uniref:Copper resistance system multicopper oxidase n=1 Tax=Gluconacetobacter entanii TaxID=108528 RepID=A0ABT3K9P3_9PROT|nr:copper resistance system multicopper oxidase [Gluconacetobacter entanii]MCW4592156.1 copper resistance system multicopper oxidase [Gluconacetobacter entanii]MCW4595835.1 copper resistance system multicopper oxidase [Gluconacetobacter entanii]NPC87371.1 copper resistance system multicopper oxidase [Gluconacetobacter entanii]
MTPLFPAKGGVLTRRRFVTGAGTWGALLTAASRSTRAQSPLTGQPAATPSTRFDLSIDRLHANITGHRVRAVGVNGATPAPILRWRQGDTVELNVTNHLHEDSSIHWHGIRLPAPMDGVPGLSFAGIAPGQTFTYRFRLHQSGTYWYHSHSGFQEQKGLYGAIIIDPKHGERHHCDREYVMLLSDWTDVDPADIVSNLKFDSDYYNFRQRTVGTLFHDMRHRGVAATLRDRLQWGAMNMAPTDILDVSGIIYTYLLNGQSPQANWTGLFQPGERIRLRFINASSMTLFDVRIPGLEMTVIQADGNEVEPVTVDEFRIGTAETYDVLVTPGSPGPYTVFAQAEDRTGYARGTLATQAGISGPVPPMDPRPLRTMTDMGMGHMDMHTRPSSHHTDMEGMEGMEGMDMAHMGHMHMPPPQQHDMPAATPRLRPGVEVQSVAMMPINRLAEAGDGLDHNGRRVLTYADLRATIAGADPRPPSREITLHLTGNMERFIWGFDGKKFSEAEPIRLALGERVRFIVTNDTMMEHPVHLHGFWSELENGQGEYRPYKHTIIVKPGERLSYLVTVDEPGLWAYHCHLLYHMELGMFRTVVVS